MSIKKAISSKLIKNFQLRDLFNQLGWNHTTKKEPVEVDGEVYQLEAIAEKSAFYVFLCESSNKVPDYATRKKIDSAITKLYHQHLIIFTDNRKRQQVWQLVVRELDKSAIVRETSYFATQEPELLYQRLQHLFFSIDEEDNITVVDVSGRVQTGFNTNAEKVTKKFYEGFKKEHKAFLDFINGISESQDKDWYASLMLNRLMFIYFIQKKGFLNNDKFYLKTKLDETQSRNGKDNFYSFYRNFLLVLFHHGLGSPDNKKFERELGKVPYLNGGLFDVHELETTYSNIKIEDKAFERIFSFFDQYEWHLDTRQQASGMEINPDVIGYIFEKYINDRAAMGAYYTKEDITDYIGKNSIIPFLFDDLKTHYPEALNNGGAVWGQLQSLPDDYIYPTIQHGVDLELPVGIAKGVDDVSQRVRWDTPASAEYALPTETWREVVERRNHYKEIKERIAAGDFYEINDLVTYNFNITKFAIDVIQNSSDPELIRHFYKTLEKITVLDPTCGSGAFLFAALNILEPLYEACIARMRAFVAESTDGKYEVFDNVLKLVDAPEHPNLQYFIFKSIILNNLYGVDIMKEAVEIAKLRLFLKLVATVDINYKKPNMGLEPLPDIDFNIRSGNTMVGFVSINEIRKAVEDQLGFHESEIADIEDAAEYVKEAYESFREVQLASDATAKEFKKILTERLEKLNRQLDVYLGKLYGKDPNKVNEYETWHDSHKPFHWLSEFYKIIHDYGGFDVIVGNPPYTEIPKEYNRSLLKSIYASALEKWSRDEDLYTLVVERSLSLLKDKRGKYGMILPLSLSFSTKKPFVLLREILSAEEGVQYFSHFDRIPSSLFGNEVRTRCTISMLSRSPSKSQLKVFTTALLRWSSEFREHLLNRIKYSSISPDISVGIPKVGSQVQADTLKKLISMNMPLSYDLRFSIPFNRLAAVAPDFPQPSVFVGGTAYNWFPAWRDIPETTNLDGTPSLPARTAGFRFLDEETANIIFALLCSSLGYWWWAVASDGFNLKKWLLERFPISSAIIPIESRKSLAQLGATLRKELKSNYVYKDNKGKIGNFFLPACENECADIDGFLGEHIPGLSAEFFEDVRAFNTCFSRAKTLKKDNVE